MSHVNKSILSERIKRTRAHACEVESRNRNSSDLYTKNLTRKEFKKHARAHVGPDAYMEH